MRELPVKCPTCGGATCYPTEVTRRYDCGCCLSEADGSRVVRWPCRKDPEAIARNAKRRAACIALLAAVEAADVDAAFKGELHWGVKHKMEEIY